MLCALILCAVQTIGVNVGSAHTLGGLNAVNPGVYAVTSEGYAAGVYHNSHKKTSAWAGKQFSTDSADVAGVKVSAAVLAGVVTGYGKPSPLVSPSVAVEYKLVMYRFSYAPKHPTKKNASDALHLSIEWRIK